MRDWNIVICDWTDVYQVQMPESLGRIVVAALSADPFSLHELEQGGYRFLRVALREGWLSSRVLPMAQTYSSDDSNQGASAKRDKADAHPDLLINLASRKIHFRADEFCPPRSGILSVNHGARAESHYTEFDLAEDWEIAPLPANWRSSLAASSRNKPDAQYHFRQVLYRDLAHLLIYNRFDEEEEQEVEKDESGDQVRDGHGRGGFRIAVPPSTRTRSSPVLRIMTDWLLTPRRSLGGETPREALLKHVDHIGTDIGHRADQWPIFTKHLPALSTSSFAYQDQFFGPLEVMFYYQLVERLVAQIVTWDSDPSCALTPDQQVDELRHLQDDFLETPQHDNLHGLAPEQIIQIERKRLPLTISKAILDSNYEQCECPTCQVLNETLNVGFWSPIDDWIPTDFVFSRFREANDWDDFLAFGVKTSQGMSRAADGSFECMRRRDNETVSSAQQVVNGNDFAEDEANQRQLLRIGASLVELFRQLKDHPAGALQTQALNQLFSELIFAASPDTDGDAFLGAAEELRTALCELRQETPTASATIDQVLLHFKTPVASQGNRNAAKSSPDAAKRQR